MLHHYLALSLKVLRRRKFFTFISLFGIAFTLVVLTVATAMLDSAFAPMAPESRQDRMLVNFNAVMYGPHATWSSDGGYKLFDQYARGLPGAERLTIFAGQRTVYSFLNGTKIASALKRTDAEFWHVFDFRFLEGGPYNAQDVRDSRFVAVINESTRERFFGAGRSAVGRTIEADGQRFQVIGVVPDVSQMRFVPFADIWAPITTAKSEAYRQDLMGGFWAAVLAKDASALAPIRSEFESRVARIPLPDPRSYQTLVAPLDSRLDAVARQMPIANRRSPARQGWKLVAVLGIVTALFMLLPAVNLVNLNVSRILERSSEIGVRKAFGASTLTLVGQFVLENIVLTLVGGLIGFAIAALVLHVLNAGGLIPYAQFTLNHRVFAYGLVLAIVFGTLSGVYPAWRMARLHPVEALKGGSR